MNKASKSLLSVLLAFVMLLPMVPAAHAAKNTTADGIVLTPSKGINVYYRESGSKGVSITAETSPLDYSGTITWSLSKDAPLSANLTLDTELPYTKTKNRSILLTAEAVTKEKSATLTVTVTGKDKDLSAKVEIRIKPDPVKTLEVKPAKISIEIGQTKSLSADARYESDNAKASVTYESENPKIATVNKSGVVTGVAKGETEIIVTAGNKKEAVPVKVSEPTADFRVNATIGTDYSLQDVYDGIMLSFSTTYSESSKNPVTPRLITFSGLSDAYAELRDKKGPITDKTEATCAFYDVRTMFFRPKKVGEFTVYYTAENGGDRMSGTITVSVSIPTTHIRVPVSSSGDYSFDRASMDPSGKTGAKLIYDALGANFKGSLKFGAITGSNVGTLYTSSAAKKTDLVIDSVCVNAGGIEELFFIPNRSGTFAIEYSAYSEANGKGTLLCSGSLIIPVDTRALDVSIGLDEVEPYLFKWQPGTGADSAYALLTRTIDNVMTKPYSYDPWGIRFNAPSAASSAVGTLRQSRDSSRAVNTETYIDRSSIADLYFVPERSGVYSISYGVYMESDSELPVATGTLTINVSTIPSGKADVVYTTTVKGKIDLDVNDFIKFFQQAHSSKYYLGYVTFDDYEDQSAGTFRYDGEAFTPYNSANLYNRNFNGDLPQYPRYLDRLTFTAPSSAGFTKVKFTCYGGTTRSSETTVTSGVLCIYYSSDDVPAVRYDAYSSSNVDLNEKDFVTVYKAMVKDAANKPVFSIRLLNVPAYGTLYRYYSKNGRTTLNSNNIADYTFTVNGASGTEAVSELTYVPNRSTSGADSVSYLAFGGTGELLYIGKIEFKLGADHTAYAGADGMTFQPSDFYKAGDADPVTYVTFPTPESGKVFALVGNRYVLADKSTKFYISSAADGKYPLTAALYVPRYGQTASVTLTCIAHRKSGQTYSYDTIISFYQKSSSRIFSDVSGGTGWAADSVDFANRLGLVNGTKDNPPQFSPSNPMKRRDLVLILYRLAGSPAVSGTMAYTDVVGADGTKPYYYDSALWAYQNGIMRGVANGTVYSPASDVLRQEFAQILFNYTKAMGISTANNGSIQGYADANQVGPETLEGVRWAVANGYFTSASTSMLMINPLGIAKRAEIVTFMHRYLTY